MGKSHRATIIVVDNSISLTGALNAILNAATPLKEEFHFIFVLPKGSSGKGVVEAHGFQVEMLPFVEINKSLRSLVLYLPFLVKNGLKLKGLADKYQAQIIHMNDFYNLTGIMAKLAGAKIQLVTHVRFMPQKFIPALANFWAKVNLKFADKMVCVSEAVRAFFPDSPKIQVIGDPIPEKENTFSAKGSPASEINLLYLSNYIPGKGQNYALQAFKGAYRQDNRLRLTFAGGDMGLEKNRQFRQSLESEVKAAGLEKVVSFESFVTDIEQKIKQADILLNFSESESFSLTCLDALFYGTPLIASDCGGPAELFEHGRSGYLVPNRDVQAMEQAILDLAADPGKRNLFSQQGRFYVREKFSPQNTYGKLKRNYLSLLSGSQVEPVLS